MTGSVALVVAAGRGHRFGTELPKQFVHLAGRPILRYALESLARHPSIDAVQTVIHPDDEALYSEAAAGLDLLPPAWGGATRQESVRRGLEALAELDPSRVLIHDGARPFLCDALIERVIEALDRVPGVLPAIPVSDTLKRAEGGRVTGTLDRSGLWRAQTPQGFRFSDILSAHRDFAGRELTDDAAVAEAAGLSVELVEGEGGNVKITSQEDLIEAERRLAGDRFDKGTEIRCGSGYDVHRFGAPLSEGTDLSLCGVKVPHDRPLLGHSDADVGLHAVTDAILGALGEGDIGAHFPPSDPQWKGAESWVFLQAAHDMARQRRGRIVHVDLTLICEAPKIGPHRDAMRHRVAEILTLEVERISIKATTTEGLGFTGRKEGIAAQALATLEMERI